MSDSITSAAFFVQINGEDAAEASLVEHWRPHSSDHVILCCDRINEIVSDLAAAEQQRDTAVEALDGFKEKLNVLAADLSQLPMMKVLGIYDEMITALARIRELGDREGK